LFILNKTRDKYIFMILKFLPAGKVMREREAEGITL
jgi:hypothetical protein